MSARLTSHYRRGSPQLRSERSIEHFKTALQNNTCATHHRCKCRFPKLTSHNLPSRNTRGKRERSGRLRGGGLWSYCLPGHGWASGTWNL